MYPKREDAISPSPDKNHNNDDEVKIRLLQMSQPDITGMQEVYVHIAQPTLAFDALPNIVIQLYVDLLRPPFGSQSFDEAGIGTVAPDFKEPGCGVPRPLKTKEHYRLHKQEEPERGRLKGRR
jgi:hypothetical protein